MYKDILVQMDSGPAAAARLGLALALAKRAGGAVRAVFAQAEHDQPSLVARRRSDALKAFEEQARATFDAHIAAAGVEASWFATPNGHPDDMARDLVLAARFADLTVLAQPSTDGAALLPGDLVEDIVRYSGRPALIVPSIGWSGTFGKRILVAWNASRESARALGDALPLMLGAEQIVVMSMRPLDNPPREPGSVVWPGVIEHLARHGLPAIKEDLPIDEIGVMDLLLSRAADHGADLLVMGGFGDHESLFTRRGVGTRFMLRNMTLPILMSN